MSGPINEYAYAFYQSYSRGRRLGRNAGRVARNNSPVALECSNLRVGHDPEANGDEADAVPLRQVPGQSGDGGSVFVGASSLTCRLPKACCAFSNSRLNSPIRCVARDGVPCSRGRSAWRETSLASPVFCGTIRAVRILHKRSFSQRSLWLEVHRQRKLQPWKCPVTQNQRRILRRCGRTGQRSPKTSPQH